MQEGIVSYIYSGAGFALGVCRICTGGVQDLHSAPTKAQILHTPPGISHDFSTFVAYLWDTALIMPARSLGSDEAYTSIAICALECPRIAWTSLAFAPLMGA